MTGLAEGDSTTARPVRARWGARTWVVAVMLVVGALVAATGGVVLARDNRRLAEMDVVGAAAVRATAAVADLAAVVPAARTALDGSAGRVDDEQVRADLAVALDAALTAARVHGATVDELNAAAARVAASRDTLVGATSAVIAEVASWELATAQAEWSQAVARLDVAVAAARALLEASAGRVVDEAPRQSLSTAVDSARALLDAEAPLTASALSGAATALAGAADSLAAPQAAVTAAVTAWTQAQAAASRSASASAAERGARMSGTKTAGAPRPSVPSVGTSPDPYAGLTWVPNAEGSYTWCTDAAGSTWWCNATPVPGTGSSSGDWVEAETGTDTYAVCGDESDNWWWCSP